MNQTNGFLDEAKALASHARALCSSREHLREHPEQAHEVLEELEEAMRYLDYIVEGARGSYRVHAETAVTMFGDPVKGAMTATYAAGQLNAAAKSIRSLREQLMGATAEAGRIYWPQHDPVAAEHLSELHRALDQRAHDVTPEPSADTTVPPQERDTIQP